MLKRHISMAVMLLGVASLTYTVLTRSTRAQVAGKRVACSATILTKYYDAMGKLRRTETSVLANRVDGSRVRMRLTVDNHPDGMKTVVDLAKGFRIAVDPVSQSITTYKLAGSEMQMLSATPTCSATNATAQTTMLGYSVLLDHEQHTFGPMSVKEDKWLAPSLGCLVMKRSYQMFNNGALTGSTVEEVIAVTVGTPDPELFQIPSDYTERTPSEAMAERAAILGKECTYCDHAKETPDKAYWSRHNF